jgi:hypothetical protein
VSVGSFLLLLTPYTLVGMFMFASTIPQNSGSRKIRARYAQRKVAWPLYYIIGAKAHIISFARKYVSKLNTLLAHFDYE